MLVFPHSSHFQLPFSNFEGQELSHGCFPYSLSCQVNNSFVCSYNAKCALTSNVCFGQLKEKNPSC